MLQLLLFNSAAAGWQPAAASRAAKAATGKAAKAAKAAKGRRPLLL
jgi:hypothetical protein